jgi:serine/threonine-protein kinase
MQTVPSRIFDSPAPGTVLGNKLRLVAETTRDMTGVLFTAQHLYLGTLVDVRMLDRRLARDAEMTRAFFSGACDLGRLKNPHVCRVLDLGVHPMGVPYVMMQHAVGSPPSAPLSDDDLDRLADQADTALEEAHASGIVHGAIDRESLIVEQRPEGPLLRILGFELARLRPVSLLGRAAAHVDVEAVARVLEALAVPVGPTTCRKNTFSSR